MTESQLNSMGWGEKWPAPAKLNLMLRITGRRQDGYHLLQTVFRFIDLCDLISFDPAVDGAVRLRNPIPGVPESEDLTVRAANLLKQYTGCTEGVWIEIDKNLPMGGGLGGGSSDAATTLLVLNRLWGLGLSLDTLMELGLRLGADVPVFVFGRNAWAEGVGEKLTEVSVPDRWVVVVKPDCHVNTRQIFLADGLTRNSKPIRMTDFLAGDARNDCLPIVGELYPPITKAIEALSRFGEAKLTGTGACVFAEFDFEDLARHAFLELSEDWQVYFAKGVDKSPLHAKLGQGTF